MDRSFSSELWSDPVIRKLEPHAKLLFTYLFTNDLSHLSGLYVIGDVMIMSELGLTQKQLDAQWSALEEHGLAYRDKPTQTVFVVNMFKRQCHNNPTPRNIAAAEKQLGRVHGSPLIAKFLAKYTDWGVKPPKGMYLPCTPDRVSGRAAAEPDRSLESRIYNLESNTLDSNSSLDESLEDKPLPVVVTEAGEAPKITAPEVIELWNVVAARYGLPSVRKLTDDLREAIKKACRDLPSTQDWHDLLAEIPLSDTLQGKIGDRGWAPSLGWLLKKNKGEAEFNYAKALNGAWRNRNLTGLSAQTLSNIEAAERAMARFKMPAKARRMITEVIKDGHTIDGEDHGAAAEVGSGIQDYPESGDDRDLPGRFDGIYVGTSDRGDYLGETEYGEVPDDRGFEAAY